MQSQQLILDVQLSERARFDNFICASKNEALLTLLEGLFTDGSNASMAAQVNFFYLHGVSGVGKTHLLHALCHHAQEKGLRAAYLPLKELLQKSPYAVLENIDMMDVVCVDDIHLVEGHDEWQEAIFHLYNRIKDNGNYFFTTASNVVSEFDISLKDLSSRLRWGLTFRIYALDESAQKQLLAKITSELGFQLSVDVIDYILLRAPRESAAIIKIINQLNEASWKNRKALTKPFVKRVLGW